MKTKILKPTFLLLILTGIIFMLVNCKKDDPISPSLIPTIVSVTPNEGSIGTELTITGTNFQSNATVTVGTKASTMVEVASPTTIYAKVPSGIPGNTLLAVKVKNPGGGEATLNNAFKAIEPILSFVNSATKPSGNVGSTVIFEGKAFGDIQGLGEVLFSDGAGGTISADILSNDDWTDEFIVTTVPNGANDGPVKVKTEIGFSNEIDFKVTEAATFSPSTINWTLTTALPVAVSGHSALAVSVDDSQGISKQYVYVKGGRDGNADALNQAVFSLINADGTITAWNNAVNMTSAISFHASVAATPFNSKVSGSGFIYVIGGINSSGATVADVSIATLNNDGTLQSWAAAKPLPQALHSVGAVIFRSTIYVAGGSLNDNTPVTIVYKAKIAENGELGEWESLPALPAAVTYHGFVTFGGYLYVVGGETAVATPDAGTQVTATQQVLYSRINLRTGDINNWTVNPSALGKERSKHTALVLGGNLFVSSGLYSGLTGGVPGSSENVYANINSDGTVGSFGGATGSNTLFSAGGSNLFNQSGISYIDADGVAHVMIIGGAKVGTPATKLANVLFY